VAPRTALRLAPIRSCLGQPLPRSALPSDHASAAFGIAFAVFLFNRVVGAIFLAAAFIIGAGRVFIGAHYPADVLAGCLVGLGSALLLVQGAGPPIKRLVRLVERATDPLLAPIWRLRAPRYLGDALSAKARGDPLPTLV